MALEGKIAESAKSIIPETWNGLLNSAEYGEGELQNRIDMVKENLFGIVIAPDQEATAYDSKVIDYASKLVVIQVIPAGTEYWYNQPLSVSATGTNEQESFPNRIDNLWKLLERLVAETRTLEPEIDGILPGNRKSQRDLPLISGMSDDLLTPEPSDFGRPFAEPTT